jgi:hypothetical protein
MNSDRLRQIEKNLTLLREQEAALEQEALLTTGIHKMQAEQRLALEIRPKIRQYEQEYEQILLAASEQLEISEPDAEAVIGEIVTGVTKLEAQPLAPEWAEVLPLLQEIRDQLNAPAKSASLKIKGMISTLPPFVGLSIEPEIDTEHFWQQHFPTFTRLLKGAVKK